MRWNVFSLETVKTALEPKFVLEKVRYVTDDEEYGEGESTRIANANAGTTSNYTVSATLTPGEWTGTAVFACTLGTAAA